MKLTYFQARGRAEPARLMLELAGAPYEMEAVSLETWMGNPSYKEAILERTPFGQLPLLQDGALTLCQSRAINRYVARKLGLYGDTIEQAARVDEVYETADEIFIDIAMFHWNPEFHERRAEHREATEKKLERMDRYFARTRADAEHWVIPGRHTLADVFMAYVLESTLPLHPGLLAGFPELHHAMTRFFAADRVREYVRSDRRERTWTVPMASFAGKPEETHHWTD
jgi:glutathione S-transferase